MPGDVKIGGGHSCFVYACVGGKKRGNPVKSAAVFDDSDNKPITVRKLPKTTRTWNGAAPIQEFKLTPKELKSGVWLGIHWD